jgi:hypothetical protein
MPQLGTGHDQIEEAAVVDLVLGRDRLSSRHAAILTGGPF